MKENLIVLDFTTGIAHVHWLSESECETDAEELVTKLGYDVENCHYMKTRKRVMVHDIEDTTNMLDSKD